MKEKIEKIGNLYGAFLEDAVKQAESGNKAAGARARKAALELMRQLKEFRKASVELTKTE